MERQPKTALDTPPPASEVTLRDRAMAMKGEEWTDGLTDDQIHLAYLRLCEDWTWERISSVMSIPPSRVTSYRSSSWFRGAKRRWLSWAKEEALYRSAKAMLARAGDPRIMELLLVGSGLVTKKPVEPPPAAADLGVDRDEIVMAASREILEKRKKHADGSAA